MIKSDIVRSFNSTFIRALTVVALWIVVCTANAQSRYQELGVGTDPRGAPELTICSQNLKNYGALSDIKSKEAGFTAEDLKRKEIALIKRFVRAGCDVISVQELLGKEEEKALLALQGFAAKLRAVTNRYFEAVTGPSDDPTSRVGYLFARDRAELLNKVSYVRVELPKISPEEKPRLFARGPLEIQLKVKGLGESQERVVNIINFHFKSKRGGADDPTGLDWETYRMEMAEALRRIVENRHKNSLSSGDGILVVLGDRNSNFDVASAKILEGVLPLSNFQAKGGCRLSKRGVPLCQAGAVKAPTLFSVLTGDPQTKGLQGTYRYKKEYSWLDDILMPLESLPAAWSSYATAGDYDGGVIYEPSGASDHALVYVRLNW